MPLSFGAVGFDADLVVFDKDGTLVEFEPMWGRLTQAWVERLRANVGDGAMVPALYRSLGYDPESGWVDGSGPVAVGTVEELRTIAAAVLYQRDFAWEEARALVEDAFETGAADIPLAELVHPVTDVSGLFRRLRTRGVRVAVVTTDERSVTLDTLGLLDVEDAVDFLVCGDDGVAVKPAPDAVFAACEQLGVQPDRTAVVGDTVADLRMGERAGAGCRVAVLTGAGDRELLAPHADVVLDSIAEIHVQQF